MGSMSVRTWRVLAIVLVVAVAATWSYVLLLRCKGRIVTIGVEAYSDPGATQVLREIDWGTIAPGQGYSRTAYIRNMGSIPCTLNWTTRDFDPPGASVIVFSTDYQGQTLAPGQILPVVVGIFPPWGVPAGDFTFTIVITARYEV